MAVRTAPATIEEIFSQIESRQADGTGITCNLPHGIRMGLDNPHRRIRISHVVGFLAEALNYFKDPPSGDLSEVEDAHDTYLGWIQRKPGGSGPRSLGQGWLWYPGNRDAKSPNQTQWIEAVGAAYSNAEALQNIVDQPQSVRVAAAEGGWVQEVVQLLDQKGGDLKALAFMINRSQVTSI
jgi:hypothetical protein